MKIFLSVCLLLLGVEAHAALNKWVDSDGQVHYSDNPAPANVNVQPVAVPSAGGSDSGQQSLTDQLMDLKKKQKAEEEDAKKAAQQRDKAQADKDRCNDLRANLNTLLAGGRIVTHDANGATIFMDDSMIQQRIQNDRKRISEECNY